MALFDERFDGWQAADFDAFAERKWASNRFNLERGRVRLRLIDLLTRMQTIAGVQTDSVELWTSPDHPKLSNGHRVRWQAAAFTRSAAVRRGIERVDHALDADDVRACHAHIGLVVDYDGLTAVLRVPAGARFDRSRWQQVEPALDNAATACATVLTQDEQGARVDITFAREQVLASATTGQVSVEALADWLGRVWEAFIGALWRPEHGPDDLAAPLREALLERAAPEPAPVVAEPTARDVQIAAPGTRTPEPKPPPRPPRPRAYVPPAHPPTERPRQQTGQPRQQTERPRQQTERPRQQTERPRQQTDRPRPQTERPRLQTDRPRDRGDRDRGPRGPRGPYQLGPDPTPKPRGGELAVGVQVVLKGGLFAGKAGQIVSTSKGRLEVSIGAMVVTVGEHEVTAS